MGGRMKIKSYSIISYNFYNIKCTDNHKFLDRYYVSLHFKALNFILL